MMKLRSVTAGAIATAMLATSAAPAMAQGYPGQGWGPRGYGDYRGHDNRWRGRNRDNTGAVVGAIVGIGIIAAIAAAASSKKRTQPGYGQQGYRIDSENAAADACTGAAEQRLGRDARVTGIDQVYRVQDGYEVRGQIDARDYNRRGGQSFACTVRYGAIERLDFGSYAYNY